MSLVENLLNQISVQGTGSITKPAGFDLNDDTFEKLLQKGLEVSKTEPLNTISGNFGVPAGMIIEPFDGGVNGGVNIGANGVNEGQGVGAADGLTPVKPVYESPEPFEIKDVDMGTDYFSGLLQKSPNEHKGLMNVAKKVASTAYNTFGKSFVENLTDFAQDIKSVM